VRTSCAKELVPANQPEGFQYLLQAIYERPFQFIRDRFPDLRKWPRDAVLAFVKSTAGQ
jgi:hypothetical protein